MEKPRIIIADTDINYVTLLQLKFAEELYDKINLEIITQTEYFEDLFLVPQKANVLIISDEFYHNSLSMHNNIEHIFLMTENSDIELEDNPGVIRIYKYSNVNVIFNQVAGASALETKLIYSNEHGKSQIIMTFSATGGVGRTLLSMSIAACLSKQFRKVLYIGAGYLQSFQYLLQDHSPIMAIDIYAKLNGKVTNTYPILKESVRKEAFYYIPPFKAPLISLGMDYSIFQSLAVSAKKTGEYDFIIVDAEASFQNINADLLNTADRVIYVTNQTEISVEATNRLMNSINGADSDKNIFICNNFDKNSPNAIIFHNKELKFGIDEYVDHMDNVNYRNLAETESIKKISMFLMA